MLRAALNGLCLRLRLSGVGIGAGQRGGESGWPQPAELLTFGTHPLPILACLASAELGKLPGSDSFWRFNRTKDYGFKGANETVEQLTATFSWN